MWRENSEKVVCFASYSVPPYPQAQQRIMSETDMRDLGNIQDHQYLLKCGLWIFSSLTTVSHEVSTCTLNVSMFIY